LESGFRCGRREKESIMTMRLSKLKSAALAALAVTVIAGGTTVASVSEAEAQWRPRAHFGGGWAGPRYAHRGWRPGRGAAVAAGIVGGLAAGALIAGATAPAYAAPVYGPGYVPNSYAPAYGAPAYGYEYQPTCYTRRVRQVVDYDTVVIRRVRVCE
jgi:hypothetical protein